MKKMNKKILSLFVVFFLSFSLFATNVEFGVAYDTFKSKNIGFFGSISENLNNFVVLEADLDYFGGNQYQAQVATDFSIFSFSSIKTGFLLSIQEDSVFPGIVTSIRLFTPKFFDFSQSVIIGFNQSNILEISKFISKTNFKFTTKERALHLDIEYEPKGNSYHKLKLDTQIFAFTEEIPIKLGFLFSASGDLCKEKKLPSSLAFELGLSIEHIKGNSSTIFGLESRIFDVENPNTFPILISLSKKVTF